MTLVVVKAEDADGEPCLWQRTEADARSLIEEIGADSALGRAEPTRRPKWARWAVVNRTAPPAPRRPVAGWKRPRSNRWTLDVGYLRATVDVIGDGRIVWRVSYFTDTAEHVKASSADDGVTYSVTTASIAAEDALRAVLVDAAAALGLRVVP